VKLASFRAQGSDRVGFTLPDGGLTDFAETLRGSGAVADAEHFANSDLKSLIAAGERGLGCLRRAYAFALAHPEKVHRFTTSQITWQPPVRSPSKIVCLALNNRALEAIKIKAPTDHPAFFLKPSTALVGHLQSIHLRKSFGLTHPEPELAVVIGRELKNVTPANAMDGVFGYTILNDVTSVGMREEDSFTLRYFKPDRVTGAVIPGEAHTSYPGRYKASDTFAPCGPFLVTSDEIPDPAALKISCSLGDRLVASDHSKNYVWNVANALAQITRTMTLLPGDIVSMGTGVGGERADPLTPEIPSITKVNLTGFDGAVSVTIEGLGTLSNPIVTEPA
jgi:2-keto-4-pentenoate hydratase/2-oxohepta-3-ene-1,7-dioic acid hydratase in catechol pathway